MARGRAENSVLHSSQGANSKMIALYVEKKVDSRIVISTNGVTHILFHASFAQSSMILGIFAMSFYGVISHIKLTMPNPFRDTDIRKTLFHDIIAIS